MKIPTINNNEVEYMNKKTILTVLLLMMVFLAGVPGSLAHPQYIAPLSAVYGDGSCDTCHVNASGGGPRNSYGTLFENQPDHAGNPSAALTAIGPPPTATATPILTPTSTPQATETPVETATTEVPTITGTGTPAAPGFEVVLSLVGLFAMALLARRHNK
jgi:PGF-CTERM protein